MIEAPTDLTVRQQMAERTRRSYTFAFNELIERARNDGFTVELGTVHGAKLAMGNYTQRIVCHHANETYRGQS